MCSCAESARLLCKGCSLFYPIEGGEVIDDWFYCSNCIDTIYPQGSVSTTGTKTCYACHRALPHYMMVEQAVYVNNTATQIKHLCPVCKNGNGLKNVDYPVAECYTCGRFFDKDTGSLISVKIFKDAENEWVTADRWLCSTHTALL